MGRAPCCDKVNVKKGPWSPEEDTMLKDYIEKHGTGGNWISLPQRAGLSRCGKSCRLRWLNYLRPNIKHGEFTDDEDRIICTLFASIGSRWSIIAAQLPGRTDNDIKNYWNTKLKKKLIGMLNYNPLQSQRLKPHQTTFSSLLENSSSSSSPQISSPLSPYYNPQVWPFGGLDQQQPNMYSYSSSLLSSTTFANSAIQFQESLLGPMQHYQSKDSLIMFGGEASTCSSSDGNYNNNHISHGMELEYENSTCGNLQNFTYTADQENQNHLLSNWWSTKEKQSPIIYQNHTFEEIKQRISNTNSCHHSNFLFDENKTEEERDLYY